MLYGQGKLLKYLSKFDYLPNYPHFGFNHRRFLSLLGSPLGALLDARSIKEINFNLNVFHSIHYLYHLECPPQPYSLRIILVVTVSWDLKVHKVRFVSLFWLLVVQRTRYEVISVIHALQISDSRPQDVCRISSWESMSSRKLRMTPIILDPALTNRLETFRARSSI